MTAFTAWPMLATGATATRTLPARLADTINVKDFGAVGNGIADDATAIQNAINAAAATTYFGGQAQGTTVFFPPGVYLVTRAIKDPAGVAGTGIIRLEGSGAGNGLSATQIRGSSVSGYVLDVPDLSPNFTRIDATSYLSGCTVIWTTGTTVWSCLRSGTSAGAAPSIVGKAVGDTVADGTVTWVLMSLTLNAATNINCLENIEVYNPSTTLGDGAFRIDRLASGVIKHCRFIGMNALHASGNLFGTTFIGACLGSSSGTNGTSGTYGAIVGQSAWHGCVISGFDVGMAHYGSDFHVYDGHIENNNTALLMGMDPTGASSPSHGPTINGNSFENNNVCLNLQNASAVSVLSNSFTGVVAVDHFSTTLTGTTTNLSAIVTGISSTATLHAGMIVTSATGIAANTNIFSVDSGTQVTLTHAATASGARSLLFQNTVTTGITVGIVVCGLIAANTVGMACSNAGIDLSASNCTSLTFIGNSVTVAASNGSGSEWILPPATHRADVTYINNDSLTSTAFPFSDLPGQPGVHIATAVEGMAYDITDGTIAGGAWGGVVSGSSSTHCRVRYNGTNWTAMGK